jgi:hypothetical protein
MVVLLSFSAIVVDLSDGYASRRQMQNAADAASLAGAEALDAARFTGGSAYDVFNAARDVAVRNGADSTTVTCGVQRSDGSTIGSCADASSVLRADAVGVSVGVAVERKSVFAPVAGIKSLTVRTQAAAATHPLASVDAPFMVCGNPAKGGEDPGLLLPDPGSYPAWKINPGAVGKTYDVHGPQVSDCNAGSNSFKGLANDTLTLPGWLSDSPGVRAGPTRSVVAGTHGCSGTNMDGCIMILPICSDGAGQGRSVQLFCVQVGAFWITQTSANKHTGRFLGGAIATTGQAGGGVPTGLQARIINLTE